MGTKAVNLVKIAGNRSAQPLTDEALDVAERILNTQPQFFPRHNGGIRVEWHVEGADIAVAIAPDGMVEAVRWP